MASLITSSAMAILGWKHITFCQDLEKKHSRFPFISLFQNQKPFTQEVPAVGATEKEA